MLFQGLGVALVTPFHADGRLDKTALRNLVKHTLPHVDFLVPLGTTGENPVLSDLESQQVIEIVLEENQGKKPILVGCGGNDTRKVCLRIEQYTKLYPIQGFLSVTPYYNKPSQAGLILHYNQVAQATQLPIVLYNVPGRTSVNMLPKTVLEIAHAHHNIVAIKESSGSLEQGMEIFRSKPAHFSVLSGDDPLALPGIALGFSGLISVVANVFPAETAQLVRLCQKQSFESALKIHYSLLPTISLLFQEGNPTGIKAYLAEKGICGSHTRLPVPPASNQLTKAIQQDIERIQGEFVLLST
ncbi:MAG: 4-hydroxy-tetrahydrodipicolinate synthase [Bacteroidia bacterium]|nr:4-hydroxy-tetrahydrodipicolinate synthase [Bacteroidia bacterium]